jgi:hypothetical protein
MKWTFRLAVALAVWALATAASAGEIVFEGSAAEPSSVDDLPDPSKAGAMSFLPAFLCGGAGAVMAVTSAHTHSLPVFATGYSLFLVSWTAFPSLGHFHTDNHRHAWIFLGVRSGIATISAVCVFLPIRLLRTGESEAQTEMVGGAGLAAGLLLSGMMIVGGVFALGVAGVGIYDSIAAARHARRVREERLARSWTIAPLIASDRNGRTAGLALTARF